MARMLPSTDRFHSRMAATNSEAIESVRPARQAGVELLQRLARPELLLEAIRLAPGAAEGEQLFDDDGPGPDGGQQQADHDEFDDRMGRQEQLEEGEAAGGGGRQLFKRSLDVRVLAGCRAVGPLNSEAAQKSRPPFWQPTPGPMSIAYPFPALRTRAILPRNVARLGLFVERAARPLEDCQAKALLSGIQALELGDGQHHLRLCDDGAQLAGFRPDGCLPDLGGTCRDAAASIRR